MVKRKLGIPNLDVFDSDADRWHTAWLNHAGADGWCLYADGYKRAADMLVKHLKTTYDVNTVMYPIMFLYRQYIELSLKEIVTYGRYLNEDPRPPKPSHALEGLWQESKSIIKKHLSDVPPENLDQIESLIQKFSELDPTSTGFRYPADKESNPSFPYDLGAINLKRVAEVMNRFSSLLKPILDMLAICEDLEREFRSNYRMASEGIV